MYEFTPLSLVLAGNKVLKPIHRYRELIIIVKNHKGQVTFYIQYIYYFISLI